jgi:CMP-N,N'-diacetyllegionaminic acid synthase
VYLVSRADLFLLIRVIAMEKHREIKVLALIPTRSGSKLPSHERIPHFLGKPLIAHSILHALGSLIINRVIVSTDDEEYATIARRYGAETPFLRPKQISQDFPSDLQIFQHALDWLKKEQRYIPDICVHLRLSYPLRKVEAIDEIIKMLIENPNIDSVRTISEAKETPFKMCFKNRDGSLTQVIKGSIEQEYNLTRQILPKAYIQNGCIDVIKTPVIVEKNSMTGVNIFGYLMQDYYNMDCVDDLDNFNDIFKDSGSSNFERQAFEKEPLLKKTFCFDIDGVIASLAPKNEYNLAQPIWENIKILNKLYEYGHTIILFTARGSLTGIDWRNTTQEQMYLWGVKYHSLLFGKPAADYYIDDKFIPLKNLKEYLSAYLS